MKPRLPKLYLYQRHDENDDRCLSLATSMTFTQEPPHSQHIQYPARSFELTHLQRLAGGGMYRWHGRMYLRNLDELRLRQQAANDAAIPLQATVLFGRASVSELQQLEALQRYIVALLAVNLSPDKPAWPDSPLSDI